MSIQARPLPLVIAGFELGDDFFSSIIDAVFSAGVLMGIVVLLAFAILAMGLAIVFLGSLTEEVSRRKQRRAKEDWPNPSYETGLLRRLRDQMARQNS